MKSMGIIGGIGPESTIEYYRAIIAAYREQIKDGNYPSIIINSINLKKLLDLIGANELAKVAELLVGEFGTRFTMQARFYPEVFSREGIAVVVPLPEEQAYIHEKYMVELLNNIIRPDTREQLLAIVDRMKDRDGIQGMILGGTELPLILRDDAASIIPFLDTTQIHAKAAAARMVA